MTRRRSAPPSPANAELARPPCVRSRRPSVGDRSGPGDPRSRAWGDHDRQDLDPRSHPRGTHRVPSQQGISIALGQPEQAGELISAAIRAGATATSGPKSSRATPNGPTATPSSPPSTSPTRRPRPWRSAPARPSARRSRSAKPPTSLPFPPRPLPSRRAGPRRLRSSQAAQPSPPASRSSSRSSRRIRRLDLRGGDRRGAGRTVPLPAPRYEPAPQPGRRHAPNEDHELAAPRPPRHGRPPCCCDGRREELSQPPRARLGFA